MDLKNKKILITGGAGFLGSYVVERLINNYNVKREDLILPRKQEYDLRDKEAVNKLFDSEKPNIVIHLATPSGGLAICKEHPAEVFYDLTQMGFNIIEASRQTKLEKLVIVGSALAYPKEAAVPFKANDIWNGYPEDAEAPYGLACRAILAQATMYRKEHNLRAIYLIPTNLYGPRDHFKDVNSHVVPSLIKRFAEAKKENKPQVSIWGTGAASREFLYVDDCAEMLIQSLIKYDSAEPLNLGSGEEITIRDISTIIKDSIGYHGDISWDSTKPEGKLRRALDSSEARILIGSIPKVKMKEGLTHTINWYLNQADSPSKISN